MAIEGIGLLIANSLKVINSVKTATKLEEEQTAGNTEKSQCTSVSIALKIKKQMNKRGWSEKQVMDAINNPSKTASTSDVRNNPITGIKNDDPATAYFDSEGNYVVQNDETGDIVQVSDKNDPEWNIPQNFKY